MRDVVIAHEGETVVDAARRMAELDVGDLVVVADQAAGAPRPVGIVTDRDLVVEVLARPERVAATTKIMEVMHRDLVLASEDEDVEAVVAKMRAHAIRRVPIVDRAGGLQGILSIDDLLGWMRDQLQAATRLVERQGRGPQLARPR